MLRIISRIVSLALIPVQLYFGYLVYKNFTAKQNDQDKPAIIKQEIKVQNANRQSSPIGDSSEANQSASTVTALTDLPKEQLEIDQNHPKIIDLTPEATVNGLTIGKTTASQAMASLGQPMSIHQQSFYIYEGINLYFKNNVLDGFIFPGPNGGYVLNSDSSSYKTSSGLKIGTSLQIVFEKYGSKQVVDAGKITYQDKTNGYVLNIYHRNSAIIGIEVTKN